MDEKDTASLPGSCDWVPAESADEKTGAGCRRPQTAEPDGNRSSFFTFRPDFSWDGVAQERYKAGEGGWAAIARQVLIGARGESARFDLRYFEIGPGGHSSLEKHGHEHVVVGIRGRGKALAGGTVREVNFLDVLYIAPDDPHQLLNPHGEPFGFLCIVNHDRDRPRALEKEELQRLLESTGGKEIRP